MKKAIILSLVLLASLASVVCHAADDFIIVSGKNPYTSESFEIKYSHFVRLSAEERMDLVVAVNILKHKSVDDPETITAIQSAWNELIVKPLPDWFLREMGSSKEYIDLWRITGDRQGGVR